jgi:hypothetical protein
MSLDPFTSENMINSKENINYTANQKKKIAERVENLKSKKHFKEIFRIVHNLAPETYTLDSSGIYINFNLLSNVSMKILPLKHYNSLKYFPIYLFGFLIHSS